MNIGDKVRFLNDVGGGTITGFRPGGIVLVEGEDGFEMPISQHEVVVIEDSTPKTEKKDTAPAAKQTAKPRSSTKKEEKNMFDGREYLQSKTVKPAEEEDVVDEQLEAKITRLERTMQQQVLTIQRLEQTIQQNEQQRQQMESRIALLEAKFNLQKNEQAMARQTKQKQPAKPTTNIGELQIL